MKFTVGINQTRKKNYKTKMNLIFKKKKKEIYQFEDD